MQQNQMYNRFYEKNKLHAFMDENPNMDCFYYEKDSLNGNYKVFDISDLDRWKKWRKQGFITLNPRHNTRVLQIDDKRWFTFLIEYENGGIDYSGLCTDSQLYIGYGTIIWCKTEQLRDYYFSCIMNTDIMMKSIKDMV